MEKDIELLESFIRMLEIYEDEELKQAIENLINRVKELEKEEKELEHLLTSQLGFNLYRDYIPKSTIKEKIEEVDKYGDCEIGSPPLYKTKKGIEIMKEDAELILQELLEEE